MLAGVVVMVYSSLMFKEEFAIACIAFQLQRISEFSILGYQSPTYRIL